MNEKIIDSHCHLDMPAFDQDRQQVLEKARAAGVMGFVVP
ncbi:TatD family hydrolase, partial [Thiolapillus sp.]